MTQYVNVGCYIDYARPRSKKAIKDALKEIAEGTREARTVKFDVTEMFGTDSGRHLSARALQDGEYPDALRSDVSYQVCGPDPYTKRNFYGTVKVNTKGVITCS